MKYTQESMLHLKAVSWLPTMVSFGIDARTVSAENARHIM